MKVRILPGYLATYLSKGGSWDQANPDPLSFTVDVTALPTKGGFVLFKNPKNEGVLTIGEVDSVVIGETDVYVFTSALSVV